MLKSFHRSLWLLPLLILSCSKSADTPTPGFTLLGTWKLDTTETTGCTGSSAIFNYPQTACGTAVPLNGGTQTIPCMTIVIAATTITATGPGINEVDPYTKTGETITFNSITQTFTLSATTLTLTYAYDPGCKNIMSFTKQ